ncbi:unnamed protein product [Protopolystoma xenopodis]|uniref:Uncharacterized protein n=1 Tax=Protopolystoma xenopodis TaxID=117903 RepID=A0A448WR26_9PLAT|nr:unnamed protein product [Protopolystoma xenopodis]
MCRTCGSGRFLDNGRCGYVLRTCGPLDKTSRSSNYASRPSSQSPLLSSRHVLLTRDSCELVVRLLAGRHLPKVVKPIVEVELITESWSPFTGQKFQIPVLGE